MPATEETYRSQPTLHVVFAITSIAMTLAIVWMIMADHLRPWKQVQREFHRIEDGQAQGRRGRRSRRSRTTAVARRSSRRSTPRSRPPGGSPRRTPAQIRASRRRDSARSAASSTRLDTEQAVPEGRARQPAQPLRRDDRPRRGGRGPDLPQHDDRRRASGSSDGLTEEFEKVDAEMRRGPGEEGRPARATSTTS